MINFGKIRDLFKKKGVRLGLIISIVVVILVIGGVYGLKQVKKKANIAQQESVQDMNPVYDFVLNGLEEEIPFGLDVDEVMKPVPSSDNRNSKEKSQLKSDEVPTVRNSSGPGFRFEEVDPETEAKILKKNDKGKSGSSFRFETEDSQEQ